MLLFIFTAKKFVKLIYCLSSLHFPREIGYPFFKLSRTRNKDYLKKKPVRATCLEVAGHN